MKRENNPLVLCLFGILPVVWLGLLLAPAAHGGLPEIVARFPAAVTCTEKSVVSSVKVDTATISRPSSLAFASKV